MTDETQKMGEALPLEARGPGPARLTGAAPDKTGAAIAAGTPATLRDVHVTLAVGHGCQPLFATDKARAAADGAEDNNSLRRDAVNMNYLLKPAGTAHMGGGAATGTENAENQ